MMLVTFSLEFWRTRFQTLITSPQVVSTSRQPFSSSPLPGANLGAKGRNDDRVAGI